MSCICLIYESPNLKIIKKSAILNRKRENDQYDNTGEETMKIFIRFNRLSIYALFLVHHDNFQHDGKSTLKR